jgi:hypothetical protein
VRRVVVRDDRLDQQEPAIVGDRGADGAQDGERLLVVPVVDDVRQQAQPAPDGSGSVKKSQATTLQRPARPVSDKWALAPGRAWVPKGRIPVNRCPASSTSSPPRWRTRQNGRGGPPGSACARPTAAGWSSGSRRSPPYLRSRPATRSPWRPPPPGPDRRPHRTGDAVGVRRRVAVSRRSPPELSHQPRGPKMIVSSLAPRKRR